MLHHWARTFLRLHQIASSASCCQPLSLSHLSRNPHRQGCPASIPPHLQIFQLPRLQRLELSHYYGSTDSLGRLSCLAGSLTRLSLKECALPPCLSALTGLRYLNYGERPPASECDIDHALQVLTQLTSLVRAGRALEHMEQRCVLGRGAAVLESSNETMMRTRQPVHVPPIFCRRCWYSVKRASCRQHWAACPACSGSV